MLLKKGELLTYQGSPDLLHHIRILLEITHVTLIRKKIAVNIDPFAVLKSYS